MFIQRSQMSAIKADLKKKMVILSGPRQVGKTYLSREIMKEYSSPVYLNYDAMDHRGIIEKRSWLDSTDLIVFDEIHKMSGWKNYLKGVFDTRNDNLHILVTGSARLEAFRGVGDSLAGRYFSHKLLPLNLNELGQVSELENLLQMGEFPEPYSSKDLTESARWRSQYIDGLIREDILDFEKIHDFKKIQLTLEVLRNRVGSTISYKSIAEDIEASPNTVKRYIEIFESLFIIFRVTPYSTNIARSLLKEPKIYFYDTGMVKGDDGARFENHAALSLLKDLSIFGERNGVRAELKYIRTKEKKEIDLCRVVNDQIIDAIEVKLSDDQITDSVKYFSKRYDFQIYQLVKNLKVERKEKLINVVRGDKFLHSCADKLFIP